MKPTVKKNKGSNIQSKHATAVGKNYKVTNNFPLTLIVFVMAGTIAATGCFFVFGQKGDIHQGTSTSSTRLEESQSKKIQGNDLD